MSAVNLNKEHNKLFYSVGEFADSILGRFSIMLIPVVNTVIFYNYKGRFTNSWPFFKGDFPGISIEFIEWPVFFYWLFISLLFLLVLSNLYFSKQKDKKDKRERVKKVNEIISLNKTIDQISESLKTLPPKKFLSEFANLSNSLHANTFLGIVSRNEKVYLTKSINNLLESIAYLASSFDTENASYSAWVMLFKDKSFISQSKLQYQVNLLPEDLSLIEFSGFLKFQEEFGGTSDGKPMSGISALKELTLFIPEDRQMIKDSNGNLRVVHGPQISYLDEIDSLEDDVILSGIKNTNEFNTGSKGIISKKLMEELNDCFDDVNGNARKIKSLVSFPITDHNKILQGVITIHSSKINILGGGKENWYNFGAIIRPYLKALGTNCKHWNEINKN